MRRSLWCAGLLLLTGCFLSLSAADTIPQGFRSWIVIDKRFPDKDERNRTGKLHCLICENGINPALAVFARTVPEAKDDPLFGLIALQEKLGSRWKGQKLGTFVILLAMAKEFQLDDYRESSITNVKQKMDEGVTGRVVVGLAELKKKMGEDDVPNPDIAAMKIGDDDEITVILYYRLAIVHRWVFKKATPPTEADLKAIEDETETLMAMISGKKKK